MSAAEHDLLERITANPGIFGGKPIIRGMRISVELVLSLLASGATPTRSSRTTPTSSGRTSRPAWSTPAR